LGAGASSGDGGRRGRCQGLLLSLPVLVGWPGGRSAPRRSPARVVAEFQCMRRRPVVVTEADGGRGGPVRTAVGASDDSREEDEGISRPCRGSTADGHLLAELGEEDREEKGAGDARGGGRTAVGASDGGRSLGRGPGVRLGGSPELRPDLGTRTEGRRKTGAVAVGLVDRSTGQPDR
jgi:hypothetical protein